MFDELQRSIPFEFRPHLNENGVVEKWDVFMTYLRRNSALVQQLSKTAEHCRLEDSELNTHRFIIAGIMSFLIHAQRESRDVLPKSIIVLQPSETVFARHHKSYDPRETMKCPICLLPISEVHIEWGDMRMHYSCSDVRARAAHVHVV